MVARSSAEPRRWPSVGEPFRFDVISADGTRIEAWTNDPDHQIDGPTVLLCNGLGTNAWSIPALLDPACGVRVLSFQHRGVGGSERPANRRRVGVPEMVEDAFAVLSWSGLDRVVLMGWSIGVNAAAEFALRHPDRVNGLFLIAGVPGGLSDAMFGPWHLPRFVNRALARTVIGAMQIASPVLTPISRHWPIGPATLWSIRQTHFMFDVADPASASRSIHEFLQTPIGWYMHLASRCLDHKRVDVSQIKVPAMLIAGRWDILASAKVMAEAATQMPDATYVELPGTHFMAMERPEKIHALLMQFLADLASGPTKK